MFMGGAYWDVGWLKLGLMVFISDGSWWITVTVFSLLSVEMNGFFDWSLLKLSSWTACLVAQHATQQMVQKIPKKMMKKMTVKMIPTTEFAVL